MDRELVYRNFPVQASSATHSIAYFRIQPKKRLGNRDKTEPEKQNREPNRTVEFSTIPIPITFMIYIIHSYDSNDQLEVKNTFVCM